MRLPEDFIRQMRPLLGEEWPLFEDAMHEKATRGIRLQRWESTSELQQKATACPSAVRSYLMDKVPWTPYGYYIDEQAPLGKTVYHEAGAFYLQEPSAMAVALAVDPQPGERILDLCAAPGGKTTAIGKLLGENSQLVANEIHKTRVRILAENIERMGVAAAVVNHDPSELQAIWSSQFDAILVDAPCSGEGMFRKDETAIEQWNEQAPEICQQRQKSILHAAFQMLKPGGRLIYSTCTFNPLENEQIVQWLIDEFDMQVTPLPDWPGWSEGRPEWAMNHPDLRFTRRLWPHLAHGEGHFVARLVKPHGTSEDKSQSGQSESRPLAKNDPFPNWLNEQLHEPPKDWLTPVVHKDIYFENSLRGLPTKGLRILRSGTPLASSQNRRITPLHGLALRLSPGDARREVVVDEQLARTFMQGLALPNDSVDPGYATIVHAGLVLGFVKAVPGRLNNLYPKGWRKPYLELLGE